MGWEGTMNEVMLGFGGWGSCGGGGGGLERRGGWALSVLFGCVDGAGFWMRSFATGLVVYPFREGGLSPCRMHGTKEVLQGQSGSD